MTNPATPKPTPNPTPNPTGHITRCAESTRGLVSQTGAIVLQANEQIAKGSFSFEQWAKSTQQLVNLFLKAALDVPTPCLPSSEDVDLSEFVTVAPDNAYERTISVAGSFVLDGEPSCRIPDRLIVFKPAVLPVYGRRFRLGTNWPDLRSGTYRGRVRLQPNKTGPSPAQPAVEMDVNVSL